MKQPAKLFDLWVRGPGLCIRRVVQFHELFGYEQVLYFLLGRPLKNQTIPKLDNDATRVLLHIINEEKLASFVAFQLWASPQREVILNALPDSFEEELRTLVAEETYLHGMVVNRFRRLHSILSVHLSNVLWLKGIGLSVLVYADMRHRFLSDFDLMIRNDLAAILDIFKDADFEPDLEQCPRYGTGPMNNAKQIMLEPNADFVACDPLTITNAEGIYIDLKLDPLDRGLRMVQLERVWGDAVSVQYADDLSIDVPCLVDQLLIACCHLRKDFFLEYRRLLDISLICKNMSPDEWNLFVEHSQVEGLMDMCFAGLQLASERLLAPVPDQVLQKLRPKSAMLCFISNALSYRYQWNRNSLPMMLLQAMVSEDGTRKSNALARTWFPSRSFLSAYYGDGQPLSSLGWMRCLCLHWLMILVTADMARAIFGLRLWPAMGKGQSGHKKLLSETTEEKRG